MKRRVLPLAAAFALLAMTACNNNDDDNNNAINTTDRDFVTKAALSNTAEIGAANIAASKATDAAIKEYAQMMIMDHTKAQDSLKTIAGQLGLYAPDSLDAEHVQIAAMLNAMPAGRGFDSAYIHGQVTDHAATINLFQNESANGSNSSVKQYVNTYIGGIQMHYTHADSLSKSY